MMYGVTRVYAFFNVARPELLAQQRAGDEIADTQITMACAPPALALPNVAHGLPVFRHCCTEHSLLHRAFTKVQRSPERAHTQPQLPSRYTARERESSGRPKLYTGHGKTHVLVARERDERCRPSFTGTFSGQGLLSRAARTCLLGLIRRAGLP